MIVASKSRAVHEHNAFKMPADLDHIVQAICSWSGYKQMYNVFLSSTVPLYSYKPLVCWGLLHTWSCFCWMNFSQSSFAVPHSLYRSLSFLLLSFSDTKSCTHLKRSINSFVIITCCINLNNEGMRLVKSIPRITYNTAFFLPTQRAETFNKIEQISSKSFKTKKKKLSYSFSFTNYNAELYWIGKSL